MKAIPLSTRITAKVVSTIFHPLLALTWAMVIMLFIIGAFHVTGLPTLLYALRVTATAFFFSTLIPLAVILLLIAIGFIKSIYMRQRYERAIPYAFSAIMIGYTLEQLYNIVVPINIILTLAGAFVALIIVFIVNFFWKISAHTTAMGGLTAFAVYLSVVYTLNAYVTVCALFLLSGIVAWARLILRCHSLSQLAAGFALGFGSVFLAGFNSSQYLLLEM